MQNFVLVGFMNPTVKRNQKKFMMFYPSDTFTIIWELIISIILLISCLITPLSLAFPHFEDITTYWRFTLCIDIVFGLEILINFRTAYED